MRRLTGTATQKRGQSHGLPVALMGRVVEDLVEAYALISSRGRLTSLRPSSDVDHKDFIFDERGGYRNAYLQVKGVTQTNVLGQVRIHVSYPEGSVLSNRRFLYLFCLLDVKLMRITRMWLIPSPDFNRLAPRPKARIGRVDLAFVAGARSKWDRYLVTPEQLGLRLIKVVEKSPATVLVSLPSHASLVMGIKPAANVRLRPDRAA
jgi:hypothetical protein